MRRRDREINIFNIAFLDVITGAMGAFILLVLLLAPYYTGPNTPPPSMKKVQRAVNRAARETKKLEKQIQRAMREGADPKLLAKLEKLLKKLKAELAAAEKQLIRLRSEVNHLESQNKKLQQENQKLQAKVRSDQELIKKLEAEIAQLKAEMQKLKQTIAQQRKEIKILKRELGSSTYHPLTVFVERIHTPNGRFDAGVPFIVACQTIWRAGITVHIGSRLVATHNDPPFQLAPLLGIQDISAKLKAGLIPFPHQKDVRLWQGYLNNGAGIATRSPNAMILQVQEANLRSKIHIWVALLGSGAANGGGQPLNSSGKFLLTATYGRQVVHRKFTLTYEKPATRFAFAPLPKQNMSFIESDVSGILARVDAYAQNLRINGAR